MLLTRRATCGAVSASIGADMLLTLPVSIGPRPSPRSGERDGAASAFLAAVARRDLLFRGVLAGLVLDHLAHHRTVAGHERRDLHELAAVPALELHHAGAFMVRAAGLDRREEPARAEVLDALLGEVEMLEAP